MAVLQTKLAEESNEKLIKAVREFPCLSELTNIYTKPLLYSPILSRACNVAVNVCYVILACVRVLSYCI